jgi:small-conductance mechanosensitive channel
MTTEMQSYLHAGLGLAGGLVLGLALEIVVLARLRAWVARRGHTGWDQVVLHALRGLTFFWCLMIGVSAASHLGSFSPETLALVARVQLIAGTASITLVLARLATGGMGLATGGLAGAPVTSSILVNLVRLVILGLGALVILQSQGISITPVLTALGVGGLAVALALQDPLSNLFAGLQILSAKKVRIGNSIRLDTGDEGTVTDIAWRYTTVVTGLNNTVLVPNAKLASAIVTNYSMPDHEVVVNVAVGVDYGSDLEQVERVTLAVAREVQAETGGAVPGHDPVLRFNAFADSAITATVSLRAKAFTDQGLVRHAFIKRLHARYRSEGIAIPFPQSVVHLPPRQAAP